MSVMANPNVELREIARYEIAVPPQSMTSDTGYGSNWKSIQGLRRILGICMVECATNGTTLTAKIMQATDASGTDAKDVDGTEITVEADIGESLAAFPEAVVEDFDSEDGFLYFQIYLEHDEGSGLNGAAAMAYEPRVYFEANPHKTWDTKLCAGSTTTTTAAATTTTTAP